MKKRTIVNSFVNCFEKPFVKLFWKRMGAFLLLAGILSFSFSCSVMIPTSEKNQADSTISTKATANGKFLGNIWSGGSEPLNFSKYWNQISPENAGKWGVAESSQGAFNWSDLDAQYAYAKSHGFLFKFHNLVWGSQQPGWISSLSATNQVLEVIKWISNVGARYSNVDMIDVVNEPIHTGQPPYGAAIGGTGSTGWDWVIFAFTQARKYCKGKLLINEYSVENDTSAATTYATIINLLKARGLIDGVGIQGHYFSMDNDSTTTLSNCLSIISAPGLPLYISELDLDSTDDATQLALYQKYFPILWNYPSIQGITLWGYIQGSMWTANAYLLTTAGVERPALTWLKQYVGSVVSSSSSSSVSSVASSSSRSSVISSSSVSSAISSSSRSSVISSSSTSSIASSSSVSSTVSSSGSSSSVAYVNETAPFTFDGAGEYYWSMTSIPSFINCWNLTALDINGVSFLNTYAATSQLPAKQNGYYYIHYKGAYAWSHFEAK